MCRRSVQNKSNEDGDTRLLYKNYFKNFLENLKKYVDNSIHVVYTKYVVKRKQKTKGGTENEVFCGRGKVVRRVEASDGVLYQNRIGKLRR